MSSVALDQARLVIRDGVAADVPYCLALDSGYRTDHVWQMNVQELADETRISYRRQRLPRPLDTAHETDARHLQMALYRGHCFIVAQDSQTNRLLAFASMRVDEIREIAYLQHIVVDRDFRGQSIGARLLNAARVWAREKDLRQIVFEIATTNYPGIQFALAQGFAFCGFSDRHFRSREIAVFFSSAV